MILPGGRLFGWVARIWALGVLEEVRVWIFLIVTKFEKVGGDDYRGYEADA